ncbi:MAG: hypothetical protein AAF542_18855 [Pseudomonadota bacterium]
MITVRVEHVLKKNIDEVFAVISDQITDYMHGDDGALGLSQFLVAGLRFVE